MRITSFVLCDSARLRPDGGFDIVNGGFGETTQPEFPARISICAVLVMEVAPGKTGAQRVEISLRDAHARRLQAWRHAFTLERNQQGAHLVLNLKEVSLPAPGDYLFDVRINGKHLGPAKTIQARQGETR